MWFMVYCKYYEKKKNKTKILNFLLIWQKILTENTNGVKLSLQKVKNRYCSCPILKERKRNYPIKDQME